jgi:GntR family transcriptional regulator/MocR family aminotransferase
MVLPVHLANLFYKKMGQNSCTVSNFEQYTLARFISKGYFEKHINRMRLYYARQRNKIKSVINESPIGSSSEIIESDSGLHFLIRINTDLSDKEVIEKLKRKGIKIKALSDYYFDESNEKQHLFIINYSNLDETAAKSALEKFGELLV